MSHLVPELSQTFDRVGIFAPNLILLSQLFEELVVDLSAALGAGQQIDLSFSSIPNSPVRDWASFTLGRRGKLDSRLSLCGMSFADLAQSPRILERLDGLYFWVPPNKDDSDRLFKIAVPPRLAAIPCFVSGLGSSPEPSLRELAVREWFRRSFKRPQFIEGPSAFLREGLEQLLSL